MGYAGHIRLILIHGVFNLNAINTIIKQRIQTWLKQIMVHIDMTCLQPIDPNCHLYRFPCDVSFKPTCWIRQQNPMTCSPCILGSCP